MQRQSRGLRILSTYFVVTGRAKVREPLIEVKEDSSYVHRCMVHDLNALKLHSAMPPMNYSF